MVMYMKPEPSPFWTKHRVNRRDTWMLYHTHPDIAEISLMLTDEEDDLEALHYMFNSLSEEQRAMVFDWANKRRERRLEEEAYIEQLKRQAELNRRQQELELRNQAKLNRLQEEIYTEPDRHEEPRGLLGKIKYKYNRWKERRAERKEEERQKQEAEELSNMMNANNQGNSHRQNDKKVILQ